MIVDALTMRRQRTHRTRETNAIGPGDNRGAPTPNKAKPFHIRDWMDYRLLLGGSLLPDIIDKPLGQAVLRDSVGYGRIYAHTFLFVLLTGLSGAWLFRKQGKAWLLVLALGSLMHDIEDQMWRQPGVLWWPLEGWAFPRGDLSRWFSSMLQALTSEPEAFIPEMVGIAILIFAAVRVLRARGLLYALKTGRIQRPQAEGAG